MTRTTLQAKPMCFISGSQGWVVQTLNYLALRNLFRARNSQIVRFLCVMSILERYKTPDSRFCRYKIHWAKYWGQDFNCSGTKNVFLSIAVQVALTTENMRKPLRVFPNRKTRGFISLICVNSLLLFSAYRLQAAPSCPPPRDTRCRQSEFPLPCP